MAFSGRLLLIGEDSLVDEILLVGVMPSLVNGASR